MKQTIAIFILNLIVVIREDSCHSVANVCPEVLQLKLNGHGQHISGIITIPRPGKVVDIKVAVGINNPDEGDVWLGAVQHKYGGLEIVVIFPTSEEWPSIEKITVGNNDICNGSELQSKHTFHLGFTIATDSAGATKLSKIEQHRQSHSNQPIQFEPIQGNVNQSYFYINRTNSSNTMEISFPVDHTPTLNNELPNFGSISYEENPSHRQTRDASGLESMPPAEACLIAPLYFVYSKRNKIFRGNIPWMVALFHFEKGSGVFTCSASLISNTYVITTADCTKSQEKVLLEFGRHNISDPFEDHYLSRVSTKIIPHPEYRKSTHGNIALISFEPIQFSKWIFPICLWDSFDTKLQLGEVAGWERNNDGKLTTLTYHPLSMVEVEQCRNKKLLRNLVTAKMFCAGGRGFDPCYGDGGGFYVLQKRTWYLRGIVSYTLGNCNLDEYSVYIDPTYSLDWIQQYLLSSSYQPTYAPSRDNETALPNELTVTHMSSYDNRVAASNKEKNQNTILENKVSWLESLPTAGFCGRISQITPLIIGGEGITRGEYPWMVAMSHYAGNSLLYKCGASLISNTYVITAAHCTNNQTRVHLEFGKYNIEDRFEDHYLSRTSTNIIRNPEYLDSTYGDVALISFDPIIFSQWITPICLWGNSDNKLRWGIVTGWGQLDNDGARSTTPKQLNVSMVGVEECRNSAASFRNLPNQTFCAGGRSSGPCHGDSGGGFYVIHRNIWYLRGVVSHSLGTSWTCNVDVYSVYVDMPFFLDWIRPYLQSS